VSDVRVNPPSVRTYGTNAQETFGSIRTSLETLVSDAVSVDYYGPNAVAFKNKCGQIASDLANALTQDMGRISDAVKATTSNIAGSLGGGPVDIQFDGAQISPPAVPQGDESVGANLPALEGLKGIANNHFTSIGEQFSNNLTALQQTDWIGTAKENAVGAVTGFTNSATTKIQEANTEMTNYIDQQIEQINRANK
jgi:hypothetical protein